MKYNEQSNCYMLDPDNIDPDGYYFPANQAGNGRSVDWDGIGFNENDNECYPRHTGSIESGGNGGVRFSGNGVEIILNKSYYNNEIVPVISDVIFSSDKIYFKATGRKGNAKVTLTNNGVRVWTWHIWCTNEPGTHSINGYTVMDRNLGAIKSSSTNLEVTNEAEQSTGLYYPYGSPIGFTVDEYSNGAEGGTMIVMKEYFKHPERPYLADKDKLHMMFNPYYASSPADVWGRIWGNGGAKTCYDPCPPGYKVTPYSFWNGISITAGPAWGEGYYGVQSGSCFFPFNGRAYAGSFTNYNGDTWSGIMCKDIYLTNAGRSYYQFTRGGRVYLWTSSSYAANISYAWHYHVRKAQTSGGTIADGGLSADNEGILTYGMGVRCVWEW